MQAGRDTWRNRFRQPAETVLMPFLAVRTAANRFGWLTEPEIGDEPQLRPADLARWREFLSASRVYLEYGAGGSTIEAVQRVATVVTVETDRQFLAAVERKAGAVKKARSFHPVHIDIGWTSKWGRPLVTFRSQARVARWRDYPQAPWRLFDQIGVHPDFIFVDGRFRVASVLESFLRLPDSAECHFMLDDFKGRNGMYGPVLEFAQAIELHDRALSFRRKEELDRAKCSAILERHYADSR